MKNEVPIYFKYWGKAKPDNKSGPRYHLLPYHCLDVAAVGSLLLSDQYPWCRKLALKLDVSEDWLRKVFSFFLVIHDLGKFARSFQGLASGLSVKLVEKEDGMPYVVRHDTLGFFVWERLSDELMGHLGIDERVFDTFGIWLEIVTGHHGQPPSRGQRFLIENHFKADDLEAVRLFWEESYKIFLSDLDVATLSSRDFRKRLKLLSWQLAGLTVLADWIGSNQLYFEYTSDPDFSLSEYFENVALPRANEALESVDLMPKGTTNFSGIQQLFDFIEKPTPLQEHVASVLLGEKSQLFILEDVTGAGKTEAAIILTQRLLAAGLADGVYVGLPTMATANAMYERLGESYRCLYDSKSMPSLCLAHGARHLSDKFKKSIAIDQQVKDWSYTDEEASASAYCNMWIADSRKKALLADIGVGTIDQALLAVLPSRYQSLRLLGLSRKILIVDEVHAYDPYMQGLLKKLLEIHAANDGNAILLSATLPRKMKQELVSAFCRGGDKDVEGFRIESEAYPLVTQVVDGKIRETPLCTRKEVKRSVLIRVLNDESKIVELIKEKVRQGECVCWIRNTVGEARRAFETLTQDIEKERVSLFHSRFAMNDRQKIERKVLDRFGKKSKGLERRGQILVATQVVEQSLDLDFDCLISDLAPIDLILQRMGRLHRHVRDREGNVLVGPTKDMRSAPVFWLLSPEIVEQPDEHWLQSGSRSVYQDVGRMWLTAKCLADRGKVSMPDDARKLIEYVYDDESSDRIPEGLLGISFAALGRSRGESSLSNLNVLKFERGYCRGADESGGWDEETNIPTRLSNDTVRVALCRIVGGQVVPYADSEEFAWDLSMVSVPKNEWRQASKKIDPTDQSIIERAKEEIHALKWAEVFPVNEEYYTPSTGFGFQSHTGVGTKG